MIREASAFPGLAETSNKSLSQKGSVQPRLSVREDHGGTELESGHQNQGAFWASEQGLEAIDSVLEVCVTVVCGSPPT